MKYIFLILLICVLTVSTRKPTRPRPPSWNFLLDSKYSIKKPVYVGDSIDMINPLGETKPPPSAIKLPVPLTKSRPKDSLYDDDPEKKISIRKQMAKDINAMIKGTYWTTRRAMMNYMSAVKKMILSDETKRRVDSNPMVNKVIKMSPSQNRYGTKEEMTSDGSAVKSVVLRGDQNIQNGYRWQDNNQFYLDLASVWGLFFDQAKSGPFKFD